MSPFMMDARTKFGGSALDINEYSWAECAKNLLQPVGMKLFQIGPVHLPVRPA